MLRLAAPPPAVEQSAVGAGGNGREWLLGVLRGLGAQEIRPQDLAFVRRHAAAAAAVEGMVSHAAAVAAS